MTRQERVEELIRREVSEILREKVSDPRIGFVSITSVEISPDLENASIFISIMGDEKKKTEAMEGLHSATRFIRGELAQTLPLRMVPKINFVRDDSLERGSQVLAIMKRIDDEGKIPTDKRAPKKR